MCCARVDSGRSSPAGLAGPGRSGALLCSTGPGRSSRAAGPARPARPAPTRARPPCPRGQKGAERVTELTGERCRDGRAALLAGSLGGETLPSWVPGRPVPAGPRTPDPRGSQDARSHQGAGSPRPLLRPAPPPAPPRRHGGQSPQTAVDTGLGRSLTSHHPHEMPSAPQCISFILIKKCFSPKKKSFWKSSAAGRCVCALALRTAAPSQGGGTQGWHPRPGGALSGAERPPAARDSPASL